MSLRNRARKLHSYSALLWEYTLLQIEDFLHPCESDVIFELQQLPIYVAKNFVITQMLRESAARAALSVRSLKTEALLQEYFL